jgi:hypothetical protein
MAIFRKYEFESQEEFEQIKSESNIIESLNTFVELGDLRDEKYSVDVLWVQTPPLNFTPYEIWDVDGNGSHTFLGWTFNKDEQYL